MTSSSSSWVRIALVAVAVCVSLVVGLAVVGASVLFWASSTADRLGPPTAVPVRHTVPLTRERPPVRSTPARSLAPASAGAHGKALRLDLDLEGGRFEIRSGPEGGEVEIDGTVAENYYELTQELTPAEGERGPVLTIQIRPTSSSLVRLIAAWKDSFDTEQANELTVTIPSDLPVALSLAVSQGESEIDLGRLSLVSVDAELTMGDHHLLFSQPVVDPIDRVSLEASMGNIQLDSIGNARAHEFRAKGRMGSFNVDLDGAWSNDAVSLLDFEHTMGELILRVPSELRIAADSAVETTMGESTSIPDRATGDPSAPMVRLNLHTTMGDTRVMRY